MCPSTRRMDTEVVTFFQQRRPGPEILVEDAVVGQIPDLFGCADLPLWAGGSPPIGAGRPDLVITFCEPRVYVLAQTPVPTPLILGYLRAVGRATPGTISRRLGKPMKTVVECLDGLREARVVRGHREVYSIVPGWREILPEIVTIEVKVADWRKAIAQAARNRIFAHRSFVAFPEMLAGRVCANAITAQLGVGVLAVSQDDSVRVVKRARRQQPRVWAYYYELARLVAHHSKGAHDAIHRVA